MAKDRLPSVALFALHGQLGLHVDLSAPAPEDGYAATNDQEEGRDGDDPSQLGNDEYRFVDERIELIG